MPKTTFEFEVSTDKSKALIAGSDYIIKPIASLFRHKGLSVQTTVNSQYDQAVDYIIDATDNHRLANLAKKIGSKYLFLNLRNQEVDQLGKINWRVVITDFLVGPNMPKESFLGRLIQSAIQNQTLIVPNLKTPIYPLHVDDLAEACWQAIIIPNTSHKKFLAFGEKVTCQRISSYLENLGQTTNGVETNNRLEVNEYDFDQIEKSYQNLNWQPKLNWQETLKKGFQSMWQEASENISLESETNSLPTTQPEPIPQPTSKPKPKPEPKSKPENKPPSPKFKPPEKEIIIVEEPVKEDFDEQKDKGEELADQFEEKKIGRWQEDLKWWQPLILILFLGFSFITAVWIKPLFRLGLGAWQMNQAYSLILKQNWQQALEESNKAKNNFMIAEDFSKNSRLSKLLFGYQNLFAKGAELGRKSTLATETAVPYFKDGLELAEAILKKTDHDHERGIHNLINYQRNLDNKLKEIQVLLKGSWQGLPGRWQNTPQKWADKIDEVQSDLSKVNQILPHLAWIIGLEDETKTFLVLLQNNMELRPTGGFIGSFALLTFGNGQLLDFHVSDVYTADGQLKGYIEPPKQIEEILGEATWYLRDSNWSPNFPTSAQNAEWFLDKSIGRQVDGVVGFNLEAAKKLIDAFGEVYLSDFNEIISSDNIFERAQFWSENEFFPGSTQKAAFLGVLGQQLFENIKAAQAKEYAKIGQMLLEGLDEKEIMLTTDNQELNLVLRQLNWEGRIRTPVCSLENCFSDYLHLNEANLGVNKSNYFLRRSIDRTISIKENGNIDHLIKINYENSAISNNWPGGDYLAWMRIYLPLETKINTITIYDPQNPNNRKNIRLGEREEKIELGKYLVGFKLEVPIQERRIVEINFNQKAEISGENFGYFLSWQKQSGYRQTPISILIDFPSDWQPLQVSPAANVVSDKLLFVQQLNRDLDFGIQLNTN